MSWKDNFNKMGVFLKDYVVDYIEERSHEKVIIAKSNQRKIDIKNSIMCFIDLKASDMKIMDLLHKYYKIDSLSECKEYIKEARIEYQCNGLQHLLRLNGFDWLKYKRDNSVVIKLETDSKLLDMPIAKLKDAIEK